LVQRSNFTSERGSNFTSERGNGGDKNNDSLRDPS
jgi:hypothetical protein